MKKYIVKDSAILHDGKRYEIGSTLELSDDAASQIALYLTPVAETAGTKTADTKTEEVTAEKEPKDTKAKVKE